MNEEELEDSLAKVQGVDVPDSDKTIEEAIANPDTLDKEVWDTEGGSITNVTISDKALSSDEVSELYEEQKEDVTEETNEAPEPVKGEDAAQVEVETPNESEIAERRKQLKSGLIEPATIENEEEAIEIEVSNRDVTEPSGITKPGGEFGRPGMSFGGPGTKKRRKQKRPTKNPNENTRRGVAKVYPELPFNNVGEGTITMDIPAKRKA